MSTLAGVIKANPGGIGGLPGKAYLSGKFPNTAIYVATADGSNPVKITP